MNDPAEGFREIYFKADKQMWESLFRNYLFSLTQFAIDYAIFGEDEFPVEHPIVSSLEQAHSNLKEKFATFSSDFIQSQDIQNLISNILQFRKKVSDVELIYYLSTIHFFALKTVYYAIEDSKPEDQRSFYGLDHSVSSKLTTQHFIDTENISNKYDIDAVDFMSRQHIEFLNQQNLLLDYHQDIKTPIKKLLINGFPRMYVEKLESFMYPKWFTACFMSTCSNSSVWGNYGDYHKGACLIFDSDINVHNQPCITLDNDIIGADSKGTVRGETTRTFDEIRYEHKHTPFNFFDCLGQMPIPQLQREWFQGVDGKYSDKIPHFTEEWQANHWKKFHETITRKTSDWAYENEYRLTLNNMFGSYDPKGTSLNYDFKSLKGIIFGIKMPDTDKHKIIEVLSKKIHQNQHYDFRFYQAYYCKHSGTIKHTELSMLPISDNKCDIHGKV